MDNSQTIETKRVNVFQNGTCWLRADFHLHTDADKEFVYNGDVNFYYSNYIQQLKKEGIQVGVITNHNKFDVDEYKALKKTAKKEGIWLVAGVELSVNDGANGIHTLIAFDDRSWLANNENYINQFLTSAFEGIANRENENTRCNYSLDDLLRKLDEHRNQGRDSFIVLAHIEQNSGFFNELEGGRIQQLAKNELFKNFVLGLQKVRTYDRLDTYRQWFGGVLPAFVEGSDCKTLEAVGKPSKQNDTEKKTYIKIGDFNFEALKYALIDKEHRVSETDQATSNSYIKSIQFIGGKLDGKVIGFSSELNSFIGIRGSGKSSIIEILRYALGINLSGSSADAGYKNDLISYILGSGGKVIVVVVNKQDRREYRIEKIYGQKENIFDNETNEIKDCSIEAILGTPIYFGQKDLSNKKDDFESDLLKRLVGNRLQSKIREINDKKNEIVSVISEIKKIKDLQSLKEETENTIKNAQQKIEYFKKAGVEEKLRQQTQFEQDGLLLVRTHERLDSYIHDVNSIIADYEQLFANPIVSESNADIFDMANKALQEAKQSYEALKEASSKNQKAIELYNKAIEHFNVKKEEMAEEFAKIKREINSDTLNPDSFLALNRSLNTSQLRLQEINKQIEKQKALELKLQKLLQELNELWLSEFDILKDETEKINKSNSNLEITIEFKGQRNQMLEKIKSVFRGTNIRETTYNNIVENFSDFIEIYRGKDKLSQIASSAYHLFYDRLMEHLDELLTFRVKDKVTINYKGKPLSKHSLGQRASALILFLLAQKDNDILIIDQPEDDLDNQTIYDEVIKEILKLKGRMQFVFATHNANIPVLGDSEKIVSCSFEDGSAIELQEGTIDTPIIQKSIVDIMEGGKDAFDRRKYIYNIWK